jgi:hypothetical protein
MEEKLNFEQIYSLVSKAYYLDNCPLCEIDFSTDDIAVLQEHFVAAHSLDTGTAKILVNLLQRIERLESRLEPDRDPLLN